MTTYADQCALASTDRLLHRWATLAWSFPVLRPYLEHCELHPHRPLHDEDRPRLLVFDEVVDQHGGSGACMAAAFVLELIATYRPGTDGPWRVGPFRLRRALDCWDHAQRAAFTAWAQDPRAF